MMRDWTVLSVVRVFFLLTVFLSASPVFSYPLIPDPRLTVGELCTKYDPDFLTYRYHEKIPYCKRNVNRHRRQDIYDDYGIPSACRNRFTIDHFIPLSLGGNNSDSNLWPEHVLVKATRPNLETELYLALSEGNLTQEEAIDIIIKEKTTVTKSMLSSYLKDGCDAPSRF